MHSAPPTRWTLAAAGLALVAGTSMLTAGASVFQFGFGAVGSTLSALVGALVLYYAALGARDAPHPHGIKRLATSFSVVAFFMVLMGLFLVATLAAAGFAPATLMLAAPTLLLIVGFAGIAFQARQWTGASPEEAPRRVARIRLFALVVVAAELSQAVPSILAPQSVAYGPFGWASLALPLVGWTLFALTFRPLDAQANGEPPVEAAA